MVRLLTQLDRLDLSPGNQLAHFERVIPRDDEAALKAL